MRTVFNNAMTAHVWAQQTQPEGRNANGSLFFDGDTIYSYGRHFPLARFINNATGDRACYLNPATYSLTTAKHKRLVWQAVRGTMTFSLPPSFWQGNEYDTQNEIDQRHRESREAYAERVVGHIEAAARSRTHAQLCIDSARSVADDSARYAEFFGLGDDWAVKPPAHDAESLAERAKSQRTASAERAKKTREANKARKQEDAKKLSAWLNGEPVPFPRTHQPADGFALLRLTADGEDIQTSRGASFPAAHARRIAPGLLKLQREVRRIGSASFDFKPIRVGHFRIDRLDDEGNVYAGCHKIAAETVEAFCADVLGVPSAYA